MTSAIKTPAFISPVFTCEMSSASRRTCNIRCFTQLFVVNMIARPIWQKMLNLAPLFLFRVFVTITISRHLKQSSMHDCLCMPHVITITVIVIIRYFAYANDLLCDANYLNFGVEANSCTFVTIIIVYVVTAVFTNNNILSTGLFPTNSEVSQVRKVGMFIKVTNITKSD